MICPRCKTFELHERPAMRALSRRDNDTDICSMCEKEESMVDYRGLNGNIPEARYREFYMHLPTMAQLTKRIDKGNAISKGELAEELYPNVNYDVAVPKELLDNMANHFERAISPAQFIWLYPDGSIFGEPAALTREAQDMIIEFYGKETATDYQTYIKNWSMKSA